MDFLKVTAEKLVPIVIILALIGIALSDEKRRIIPNVLLAVIAIAGIYENFENLVFYLISSFYFLTVFFVIYKKTGGMGFGDVKFVTVLSFLLGFWRFIITALAGTMSAIIYRLLINRKCQLQNNVMYEKIPYGTFLALSAIVIYLIKEIKK